MTTETNLNLITETVDIVSAYVSKNAISKSELPDLIASVHTALHGLHAGPSSAAAAVAAVEPATPGQIRKSITPDALISFIDGRSYKTLKRHLTQHGFTPETYRQRYGLPVDYPTTCASYSAQRSALAKQLGLGRPGNLAKAA